MAEAGAPRILITNDDGARAEGLKVLEEIARTFTDDVWIVAPELDQSGVSHAVSLHEPLRVHHEDERRMFVRGTPADCVLLGIEHLVKGKKPDLVLAGVNRGGNMADAIAYSGTVGGAMTALAMKTPSIALSQLYRDPKVLHWETARRFAPSLIARLMQIEWPQAVCYNVNFPACPPQEVAGVVFARPAHGMISGVDVDARVDVRGGAYHWITFRRATETIDDPDSDIVGLRNNKITITPLRPDRHAEPDWSEMNALAGLQLTEWFAGLGATER